LEFNRSPFRPGISLSAQAVRLFFRQVFLWGYRRRVAAFALALSFTCGLTSGAAAQRSGKADRKILVSVKPDYPDFLRHAQIGGMVRLKATVGADGKVTFVDIVGGNPILAENAAAAVLKWKYAPGPAQTIEDVALNFNPH
jgi:TonB family protein